MRTIEEDPETVDAAVRHGASHAGFVFFPRSPRHVAIEQARALTLRVPDHVGKVGVFVDPDDALIEQAIRIGGIGTLQLHGKESPERLAALRARHPGVPLWKAIPVRTRADLDAGRAYAGAADLILYDAKTPEGTLPGGYAADESVGLHYVGTEFVQAVSYRQDAGAYRVEPDGPGTAKETRLEPRRLASL